MEINQRAQVIAPQGDGWVRSFDAMTGELIWKCEINPKSVANRWMRNHFLNAPVFHDNLVYIGGGQSMEEGSGPGRLFCIDPTRKGDLSRYPQFRPQEKTAACPPDFVLLSTSDLMNIIHL
jgi:outer membrane protein assembly factor BamB